MEREREEEEEKEKKEEGVVTTVPSQAVVTFTYQSTQDSRQILWFVLASS